MAGERHREGGQPRQAPTTPDLGEQASHTRRLYAARDRARRSLELLDAAAETEADWRGALLPAARQLLAALRKFVDDEAVWAALKASQESLALDERARLRLSEAINQDLTALLVYLGYRPPPPAERLDRQLKEALADVLEIPDQDAVRAMRVRRAQSQLLVYIYHLQFVIEQAEQGGVAGPGSRPDGRDGRRHARLRSAVRRGAEVALPAAVAAGAVAAVLPPAGPAAAEAFGQELLKQAIQLGGTELLGQALGEATAPAEVVERFAGATLRTWRALEDLVDALDALAENPDNSSRTRAKAVHIECISAMYGLLQAELDLGLPRHRRFRAAARQVLGSLDEVERLMEPLGEPDELLEMADALEADTQALSEAVKRLTAGVPA